MQMLVGVVCQSLHNMILQTFHFAGWLNSLCAQSARSHSIMIILQSGKSLPLLGKTLQQVRMLTHSMPMIPYSQLPTTCPRTLCGGSWKLSQHGILFKTPKANGSPPLSELSLAKEYGLLLIMDDRPHFGHGHQLPPGPLFHSSVKRHMEDSNLKYKPKAWYKHGTEMYVS